VPAAVQATIRSSGGGFGLRLAELRKSGGARLPVPIPKREAGVSEDPSDKELALRAREGDEDAFRRLVDRHRKKAYWTAYNIVHSHEEALDVAQEAFVRVFRFLHRYDPKQQFSTWLYQIVVNLAIDSLRRNKNARAAPLDQLPETPDSREGPVEEAQRAERRRQVWEVLGTLPEAYRVVLVLRDIEGLPSREVASILGINHATVRWRLHLARGLFKRKWEARFGVESGIEG